MYLNTLFGHPSVLGARSEELTTKIKRTDEIVYEQYGLTDEEIGIVSDAVGDRAVD